MKSRRGLILLGFLILYAVWLFQRGPPAPVARMVPVVPDMTQP